MKIHTSPNLKPLQGGLPKPPALDRPQNQAPKDGFRPQPFDREKNQRAYATIARSMAWGAGLGGLAGGAAGIVTANATVPMGMTTALGASAGLITGAWLGLVVGYVGC